MKPEQEVLVTDWFRRAREAQAIHYECGAYFSRMNYWLGIPTIAFTTIVGTAVFATLEKSSDGELKIAIGLISILASLLAALQTFLGFSERAVEHKRTAAGYSVVRRELEYLKTFHGDNEQELAQRLKKVQQDMDHLAELSPGVPRRIWDRKISDLQAREHRRIFHLPATRIGTECLDGNSGDGI